MNNSTINAIPLVPSQPNAPIIELTDELLALMQRHGVVDCVIYTLTPNGSILSHTSDAALLEAHSLLSVRVHQIKAKSSQTSPLHE